MNGETKTVYDGGPAFPIGSGDERDPTGMSLRAFLAAHALEGIARKMADAGYTADPESLDVRWAGEMAVALADSTIQALRA